LLLAKFAKQPANARDARRIDTCAGAATMPSAGAVG
jgi:hypothetical protein